MTGAVAGSVPDVTSVPSLSAEIRNNLSWWPTGMMKQWWLLVPGTCKQESHIVIFQVTARSLDINRTLDPVHVPM